MNLIVKCYQKKLVTQINVLFYLYLTLGRLKFRIYCIKYINLFTY